MFCAACCADGDENRYAVTVVAENERPQQKPILAKVEQEDNSTKKDFAQDIAPANSPLPPLEPDEKALGSNTYVVDLKKISEGSSIGLDLSVADGITFRITGILPGICSEWNLNAADDSRIRFGDRIIECNGIRADAKQMLETLRTASSVKLLMRHPEEFKVLVEKSGESPVGLDVSCKSNRDGLLVRKVGDGIVSNWNKTQPPELQVNEKDFIVEVNGLRGEPKALLQKLKESTVLELSVIGNNA